MLLCVFLWRPVEPSGAKSRLKGWLLRLGLLFPSVGAKYRLSFSRSSLAEAASLLSGSNETILNGLDYSASYIYIWGDRC